MCCVFLCLVLQQPEVKQNGNIEKECWRETDFKNIFGSTWNENQYMEIWEPLLIKVLILSKSTLKRKLKCERDI